MKTIKSMITDFAESITERMNDDIYKAINKVVADIKNITAINKYTALFPEHARGDLDIEINLGTVSITFSMWGEVDIEKDIPKISPGQRIIKLFPRDHEELRITIEFYITIEE